MKIISWNVNGLRAIYKKGAFDELVKLNADIFCLQETKAEESQLIDEIKSLEGYFSYFASSKVKKGYSGVAVYSKTEPLSVERGIGDEYFDNEGRILKLEYKDFFIFNVYFPNGGGGEERLNYKMDFYDAFLIYIEKLRKKTGKEIIFCGDVNTAHNEIDLARPKENSDRTGFLPMEREWIDTVINTGYIDTFRHFFPDKKEMYSWWDMKTRARERNVGWRIDYFFVSNKFLPKLKNADIMANFYGSDHCPVFIEVY